MFSNKIKKAIATEIVETLGNLSDLPNNISNVLYNPFYNALLNPFFDIIEKKNTSIADFISLSSWMNALNTTLGQTFLENVIHILSCGEKKEFKNLKISHQQQTQIYNVLSRLKNGERNPDLEEENDLIFANNSNRIEEVENFIVDCYFEDNVKIVCIDIKIEQPNDYIFRNEKDKILTAKAALKNLYPDKEIYYYLGFPFDPTSTSDTAYDKTKYMKYSVDFDKFIDKDEVLLAGELWDFLSEDTQTMEQILEIINAIAKPDFLKKFNFINEPKNMDKKESYIQVLQDWYLSDEGRIIENLDSLIIKAKDNKDLQKALHQSIFSNGKYNYSRFKMLFDNLYK